MKAPRRAVLAGTSDPQDWEHLQRLMGSWAMLADLSFADLLLFVPSGAGGRSGGAGPFTVIGQVRPSTSQTLHGEDLIGRVVEEGDRALLARCWRLGEIVESELNLRGRGERVRSQCIPVRRRGRLLAVLDRESPYSVGRRPGELERVYVELFDRFATMVVAGDFPFAGDEALTEESPRVSDGVVVLDPGQRVVYVSPNAITALHRLGVYSRASGMRLDELGIDGSSVRRSFTSGVPVIEEIERPPEVIVLLRCVPLLAEAEATGAVLLLRDVTDLRRRDRLLLSKDATIREIHHRVKNNLQTISSLLHLQARRVSSDEGRDALREAEVRVRSIAAVHEILSREVGEQVPFREIVRLLVRMAEEAALESRPVAVRVRGDAGELVADVATPLAVALSELLQNAVEHAFRDEVGEPGPPAPQDQGPVPGAPRCLIEVVLENDGTELSVQVRDNGRGLPPGLELQSASGLGLSIVSNLVVSQLQGSITMRDEGGAVVDLRVPLSGAPRRG